MSRNFIVSSEGNRNRGLQSTKTTVATTFARRVLAANVVLQGATGMILEQ